MSTPTKASSTKNMPKSTVRSNPTPPPASLIPDDESLTLKNAETPEPQVQKSTSSTHSPIEPGYTHTPPLLLLAWLIFSLPLVAWDTLYVQSRPHTMPGGRLRSPLWTPYALYGSVDLIYGWPAWNNRNDFTAAQRLQIVDWSYEGIRRLEVKGKGVRLAVLLGFSAAVMTVSKSLLYFLNEAFSDFVNFIRNSLFDLIVPWIIPNGAWIVFPSYIIYVLGKEILESMNAGSNGKEMR